MPMSRAEIELVLTARNQANAAFEQLNRQIQQVAGESGKATEGMGGLDRKTDQTRVTSIAAGAAIGLLADRLARSLVTGFKESIDAANRLDAGLIGLSSVAKAFGGDADDAKRAAQALAADGLLSVGEAATGLKNLLASGFNLDQAIVLMNRFKDSSAFGRQAALSLGQAVTSATEGIKNGNSILVDNAGVTKNLSIILREAGFAETDLSRASTDATVRMALFKGLLKETNPQLGDAARYLETAAGKQAQFHAQVEITQQKLGKALQPALAAATAAGRPFVQFVGDSADKLVPMAAAAAAVVIPLAAMRGAAALGVTSLGDLTGALRLNKSVAEEATLAQKGLNAAIKGLIVIEAFQFISLIVDKMEALRKVAQGIDTPIGKFASEWIRALETSNEASNFVVRLKDLYVQVTDLAGGFSGLAFATREFGEAARSKDIQLINTPFEALLRSGRPAKIAVAEVKAELQALSGATIDVAGRTNTFQSELDRIAGAGGLGKLRQALQSGLYETKELATAFGVSEDAIKFYSDQLKNAEDRQKKAADAAKKLADEQQHLRDSLREVGLITREQVNAELQTFQSQLRAATDGGVSTERALAALIPILQQLDREAKASGTETRELAAALAEVNARLLANQPTLRAQIDTNTEFVGRIGQTARLSTQAQVDAALAQESMQRLGITSREELQKTAAEAAVAWRNIVRVYGEKSPEATAAFKKMIEAQKAASGELPPFWQRTVMPSIVGSIDQAKTAILGSFAQMSLGAKGFGDGFKDILNTLKQTAIRIFADIANYFVNNALRQMLGALQGQQGGLAGGLAGVIAPALGGGGTGGFGLPGGTIASIGNGGGATAARSGLTGAQGAGIGLAIGGGLQLIGGLQSGSKGLSTLGGLQTGAGIGLTVGGPIGALIGGGIGALGGFVGGLFSGGAGAKANDVRDEFKGQFGDTAGAGLQQQVAALIAGPDKLIGQQLSQAYQQFLKAGTPDAVKAAISQITKLIGQQNEAISKLQQATAAYGLTWEDMGPKARQSGITDVAKDLLADTNQLTAAGYEYDKVLEKQASSYSELANKSDELGTRLPDALKPVLQHLIDMGLLVDANGRKYEDLSEIIFDSTSGAQIEANKKLRGLLEEREKLEKESQETTTDDQRAEIDRRRQELEDKIADLREFLKQNPLVVPVEFGDPGSPPSGAGSESPSTGGFQPPNPQYPAEGGAAGGVMANRPGLVLFGEGGVPEVGGPASFFRQIFQSLGVPGDGPSVGDARIENVIVLDGQVLARSLGPSLIESWRRQGVIRR